MTGFWPGPVGLSIPKPLTLLLRQEPCGGEFSIGARSGEGKARRATMRLPEAKIKEALLHPDKLVRQEALHYFADCCSRDAEVMALAINTIETYGRSNAFLHV